ncbi:MAG TPA: glycoside hydrolase family 43 protein [Verrucomicrobiae bacterium]|jgi:beta-galactosidase
MKNCALLFAAAFLASFLAPVHGATGEPANEPAIARASFLPDQLWPSVGGGSHINCHGGGMLRDGDTWYWFGEKRGRRPSSQGVSVYSSKDLYNWQDLGMALAPSSDTNSDITSGCVMERPKALHNAKTGHYVMWFHLELRGRGYNAARAAVAVSDQVTGPYRFVKSFRPNGNMSRDMDLFQDDDGRAYHIYSARDNYDMRICQLSEDYLSPTANDVLVAQDHREAPAMFKHQGTYYLITSACTGWRPNAANYYTASRVLGPWTAHDNPCLGTNAATTFRGQSSFVLPLPGQPDAFIFMADRWMPSDLALSRYIWLPIQFKGTEIEIAWRDEWKLNLFATLGMAR